MADPAPIRDEAREALALHFDGQREEALARADELARAHPGSALALNVAGYLHRLAGFAAWDDRGPGDDEAASALESYSHHHRAALHAFSAAARLAPGCVLTALARAETLAECHRYEDARAELFRVLSMADHTDPALHNVVYDLDPDSGSDKHARNREAVARANLAMERFLAKINRDIIPMEAAKLLDANNLGGPAATEARDRAKLLADKYPYSARAQVLRAYIDLAPVRTLDTAMDKKQLLRRVLGIVRQAAANFDCSLLIALFHAKLLFFLYEVDAAERECRRALLISRPNDPNSDDIPPMAVPGDDFDARVSFVQEQLRVLLKQIIDVSALFWSSMESTQHGARIISVKVDTLHEYYDGVDGSAAKTISDARSFLKNHSSWAFWICLNSRGDDRKFLNPVEIWQHMCSKHGDELWWKLQSVIDPEYCANTSEDAHLPDAITLCTDSGQDIFLLPRMQDLFESLLLSPSLGIKAEPFAEMRQRKCREGSEILESIKEKLRMLPKDTLSLEECSPTMKTLWLKLIEISSVDYRDIILRLARAFQWIEIKRQIAHVANNPHRSIEFPDANIAIISSNTPAAADRNVSVAHVSKPLTEYLKLTPIDVHESRAGKITHVEFDKKGISGQSVKGMESTSNCQENLSVFNKNSADKLCTLSATLQPPVDMDYLSNLSEDTLLLILSRVTETKEVAGMSILSRYLRNLWVKLSTLTLWPNSVRAALSAYEALQGSGIRRLNVHTLDRIGAEADATASWLRFAESRVLEEIFFHNRSLMLEDELLTELVEEDMVDRGTVELPCITRTCSVRLKLGNLGLNFPASGIFSGLTALFLENVRLQSQVSIHSIMFPRLLHLTMKTAHGMVALEVKTDTLSQLELLDLQGFERLLVNAQALRFLTVQVCFLDATAPVVNIAAESLQELRWQDIYDENTVSLGLMPGLRLIAPPQISKDWHEQVRWDQICASFLKRFSSIETLELQLTLEMEVEIPESPQPRLMEEIRIPSTEILRLSLCTDGHSFGESVMHLLSRCTGIKELSMTLYGGSEGSCPQDCTCGQTSSRTQNFPMTSLQKVDIKNFSGVGHEVNFVEQLLRCSPALESVTTEWNGSLGIISRQMKSDSEISEPG